MGGEVRDPARSLPRSILVAAPLIAGIYIVGTLAVLATFSTSGVDLVTGVVEAIGQAGERLGLPLFRIVGFLIVLTGLGGFSAWLAGSARIPFVIGLDRYLPSALGRVHHRWGTPHVSLLVQGVGASIFILLGALGSSVEEAYMVLVDTTIIVYFIPYLYLFLSLASIRRRRIGAKRPIFNIPGGMPVVVIVAASGFATTTISIVLATLPTEVATSPLWFFVKVVGGAVGLIAVGLVFYFRGLRSHC